MLQLPQLMLGVSVLGCGGRVPVGQQLSDRPHEVPSASVQHAVQNGPPRARKDALEDLDVGGTAGRRGVVTGGSQRGGKTVHITRVRCARTGRDVDFGRRDSYTGGLSRQIGWRSTRVDQSRVSPWRRWVVNGGPQRG